MNIFEVDNFVDELIDQGKSIDEIVYELARQKCYYTLVEIVLAKKKLWDEKEIIVKIKSHEFYSEQLKTSNPFTEDFIKSIKKFNSRE